jgi:putative endonuclease
MRQKTKEFNTIKGQLGENIACEYLIKRGFLIRDRNYRKKWGEIDIIATKDNKLHFIEVKSVNLINSDLYNNAHKHRAEENVHPLKIHRIRRTVLTYLDEKCQNREGDFAFHIICVYLDFVSRKAKIKIIENIIL